MRHQIVQGGKFLPDRLVRLSDAGFARSRRAAEDEFHGGDNRRVALQVHAQAILQPVACKNLKALAGGYQLAQPCVDDAADGHRPPATRQCFEGQYELRDAGEDGTPGEVSVEPGAIRRHLDDRIHNRLATIAATMKFG